MVTGAPGAGATTLALTLLVGASRSGSWCGLVGLADPGVVAMAELGLDLLRLALVPAPGGAWAEAAATLLDGVDVVLVRAPGRVGLTAGRLLSARAKERKSALVVLGARAADWPEAPDLTVTVTGSTWVGIGTGHGHLRGRRAELSVTGRRSAGRETRHTVWLPAAAGAAAPLDAGHAGRSA